MMYNPHLWFNPRFGGYTKLQYYTQILTVLPVFLIRHSVSILKFCEQLCRSIFLEKNLYLLRSEKFPCHFAMPCFYIHCNWNIFPPQRNFDNMDLKMFQTKHLSLTYSQATN